MEDARPAPLQMKSLGQEPDKRVLRYLKFYDLRLKGTPEGQVVKSLGFDSPSELYVQLRKDGFPVCEVCGETPTHPGHCEKPAGKRKRRAQRGAGNVVDLPPTVNAKELFGSALAALSADIDDLGSYKDHLQDERFVATHESLDLETALRRTRDSSGQSYVAHPAGARPNEHGVVRWTLPESRVIDPLGAGQFPPEPIVALIAVYILADLPIEDLLQKLHPEPEAADLEQLKVHIEGKKSKSGHIPELRSKARQVARLIRGGTLKPGPPTGELTTKEQFCAGVIHAWRESGHSDAQIHEALRGYDLTREDIARLGNLRLESLT